MKYGLQQHGDYKLQLPGIAKSSTFQGYKINYSLQSFLQETNWSTKVDVFGS